MQFDENKKHKFPLPPKLKSRSKINFNNINEEEINDFEVDAHHSKSFCRGMIQIATIFHYVDGVKGSQIIRMCKNCDRYKEL